MIFLDYNYLKKECFYIHQINFIHSTQFNKAIPKRLLHLNYMQRYYIQ